MIPPDAVALFKLIAMAEELLVLGIDAACNILDVDGMEMLIFEFKLCMATLRLRMCEFDLQLEEAADSKSNNCCCTDEALAGELAVPVASFDFGDGFAQIGMDGSANRFIWCITPSRRK